MVTKKAKKEQKLSWSTCPKGTVSADQSSIRVSIVGDGGSFEIPSDVTQTVLDDCHI